jgi:hypothetical protein
MQSAAADAQLLRGSGARPSAGSLSCGFGSPPDYLDRGLGRIEEMVSKLSAIA